MTIRRMEAHSIELSHGGRESSDREVVIPDSYQDELRNTNLSSKPPSDRSDNAEKFNTFTGGHGTSADTSNRDIRRVEDGFHGGLGLCISKSEGGYIYIEFPPDDPIDPMNWSLWRKVATLACTFAFAAATAINGTGYNSMQKQMTGDFEISQSVFLLGNVMYLSIGVAFTPLLLAPLSEIFGRLPIFLTSALLFSLLYIPAALTHSFAGFLIVRLLQGCVASVGNSMVGGTVSDIFPSTKRGLPMSTFALSIYMGQAIGPFTASYTVNNPALGWRWAFGWQGILCGFVFASMALLLRETRGPVLLSRRAAKLTAQDEGGRQYRCSADDDRVSFWIAVKISLSRPAWWLISEPVVTSFSLWIGFLWGCVFLLLESVPIVFEAYGWSDPQQSLVLLTLGAGAFLAWAANFYQEWVYARIAAKTAPQRPAPEARLYFACVGGCLAPIGFFIFAWTGRPEINPAAPIVGLVIFAASTFWIYLAVFTYLAECYEIYASSGLAAQSWLRNFLAGIFPLFAPAMYHKLHPPVASTILGAIAAVLGACPFILLVFGGRIRAKSRVAQALALQEEERRLKMDKERDRNLRRQQRCHQ